MPRACLLATPPKTRSSPYGDPATQPRATHTPEETAAAMAALDAELTRLDVPHHLQMGRGGWEGGGEPTFVLTYQGNGRVFRLLLTPAKDHGTAIEIGDWLLDLVRRRTKSHAPQHHRSTSD